MPEGSELLEWAAKQARWVRDALRRHAMSPNLALAPEEAEAVVQGVRHAAGEKLEFEPKLDPIESHHLTSSVVGVPKAILCSLGPVENLARLAPNQALTFAIDGITLIYGDNGAGKSGYCRVAKKLCRSISKDELLGNVFESGAKPPARVLVRYLPEGEEKVTECDWVDGQQAPEALAGISVFDSRNATLYVTKQNKVEFLPIEIALLEQHAAQRSEMAAIFTKERAQIERRLLLPLPGGFGSTGAVASALAGLSLSPTSARPSRAALEELAVWTEDQQGVLESLEAALAHDPTALARQSARDADALESLAAQVSVIETELGVDRVQLIVTAKSLAVETASAAALAASDLFKHEPIGGVGGGPWRLMYDHARAYLSSAGEAAGFEAGDPCALCQQPLDEEASERLKRFTSFVLGEAAKAAQNAEVALKTIRAELVSCVVADEGQLKRALAEYSSRSTRAAEISAQIEGYFRVARQRKIALLRLVDTGASDVADLGTSPAEVIQKEITLLSGLAMDVQAAPAFRDAEIANLSQLKDRKKLSDELSLIFARLDDLEAHDRAQACLALVNNQQVSLQITTMRRQLVSGGLADRIQSEIDGLLLSHVPFAISDGSTQGESWFKIALKDAGGVSNDKVLSEGEQRALALACFLAEVGEDNIKHGLIIDDPVSSLDHLRIRRVAERLVAEASKGKQLIVFTHNLLFYNEVKDAAARASVPLARRLVSKSASLGFGLITEDTEPWMTQPVSERIVNLRSRVGDIRDSGFDPSTEDYRRDAKDFYSDLRETWERLVEELLLGKVVERLNSEVKTQSLKGVEVTDSDYKTVFWAMKRASERSGHDRAAGKGVAAPTTEEMLADVRALDEYRKQLSQRRKQLQEQRKALEEPPAATTA